MTNCCVRGFPNLHGSVHMAKGQNQNCTFFTDKGRASTSAAEMKADQFPAIPLPNGAGRGPPLNPKTMLCQHCQELARSHRAHPLFGTHILTTQKTPTAGEPEVHHPHACPGRVSSAQALCTSRAQPSPSLAKQLYPDTQCCSDAPSYATPFHHLKYYYEEWHTTF